MGKSRFLISLIFAKLAYLGLKITKLSGGTAIIGKYVLKICPDFLKYAGKYIEQKINITGTNGKTTTSGLISHLIKSSNHSLINNAMGANMLNGVVNAISVDLNPFFKYDYSVIESDEAFLEVIYQKFEADYLLVTNLFRDQLDRYGELATTKKFIQNGIDLKPNLKLILNADDPLVASFVGKNKIYYGVENVIYKDGLTQTESKTEEAFTCHCGNQLKYDKKFYAQQGHYFCNCGYKRPQPKYSATVTLYKDHSVLELEGELFEIPLVGLFNAYNALGAIALCKELGIQNIAENIKTFKVAFGRSEVKYLNGKRTLIQLIKNPVGANEVLKTINKDANILIAINDNYADGRDVSWLWDADFSVINTIQNEIVVSGTRAEDMALRLKYAGVAQNKIKLIKSLNSAIDYIGKISKNDIIILPTYTALLKLNKMKSLKRNISLNK
ncbi:DUF1727 domain-containing protein [bacterium]|nr:DUF1727 domain-containing protein [bacterium]